MKVYMIGQYQFDGSEPSYRCFYEESDAKSCARELRDLWAVFCF